MRTTLRTLITPHIRHSSHDTSSLFFVLNSNTNNEGSSTQGHMRAHLSAHLPNPSLVAGTKQMTSDTRWKAQPARIDVDKSRFPVEAEFQYVLPLGKVLGTTIWKVSESPLFANV
jgi:hypothetical protein